MLFLGKPISRHTGCKLPVSNTLLSWQARTDCTAVTSATLSVPAAAGAPVATKHQEYSQRSLRMHVTMTPLRTVIHPGICLTVHWQPTWPVLANFNITPVHNTCALHEIDRPNMLTDSLK